MKRKEKQPIVSPFLPNISAIKDASIKSMRHSFEIEGIYFSDEEFQQIVAKALNTTPTKS